MYYKIYKMMKYARKLMINLRYHKNLANIKFIFIIIVMKGLYIIYFK